MTRQAGGTVEQSSQRGSGIRSRSAKSSMAGKHSRRGGVLLEPLPAILPAVQTELKLAPVHEPTEEEIRVRAYQIYLHRGRQPGHEVEDWVRAENELRHRLSA